jgi:uncharacterized protein GlcG (DUF336 family)
MIVTQAMLSSEAAMALVQRAVAHARAEGWAVAAAVVDPQGIVQALWRMDGVAPNVADFALDKAYTAATMRRSTAAFAERMGGVPSLALGLGTRTRLLTWGGGLPVVHGGGLVGGIGVSGAKDHEDIACAETALASAGFGWEVPGR